MPAYTHHGRVAFHGADAAGIVRFSNYFRYAEETETAALASLGIFSADSLRHCGFPRVQAKAQYNAPLHFFEEYTVHACITRIGNSSLTWRFEVQANGKSCATLDITSVRISAADGRPLPYFPQEKEALRALMPEPEEADNAPRK